jgi:hypothetical protein
MESEGYDRANMELSGHMNAMIHAVCAATTHTAVVL